MTTVNAIWAHPFCGPIKIVITGQGHTPAGDAIYIAFVAEKRKGVSYPIGAEVLVYPGTAYRSVREDRRSWAFSDPVTL